MSYRCKYTNNFAYPLMQLNLDGDKQANFTVHGAIDKAVYIYLYINHLTKKELNYGEHYA